MPTVLGGKGKLSIVCFLLRCAYSQVTRSQHNGCAKDIFEDMTQSWPSQQALVGDQQIFYNSKDAKQSSGQQRQNRGDAPLRMPRHPYVAPHKSMLADDLKLSSDDDDTQRAINESTSWARHSLSAKRAHTHGRRCRIGQQQRSFSEPSPEVHPGPLSPANPLPPCNDKETDHPSPTQWQLDKWLKRSKKKSDSTERNHSWKVPERQRSPQIQRAPSPAKSWDSHQEYSPSQSPIPSPKFNHSPNNSPIPSPGYSYCPSPSPFPSTCPSPTPSPRHISVPSPARSLCPSPCGSPRASRSPSPLPKHPPRSPSPTLRTPTRVSHYLDGQNQIQGHSSLTSDPHRTRIRPWFAPVPAINTKTTTTNSESEFLISTAKVSADSISHKTFSKKGHQVPSRPDAPRPQAVHSRGPNSGPPCEGQQSERKQKLYTLVPFGRSEKAAPTSQRGLRNLVVHIDLCLLKRVPDSSTNSPVKKNTSSSSSSSTKDRQREVMKHTHVPDASTKDGKRKRKLENGVSDRECKRSQLYPDDPSGPTESSVTAETLVTETTHNGYLEEYLDKRPMSPLSPLSPLPQSPEPTKPTSKTKTTEQQNSRTQKSKEKSRDQPVKPKMEVECVKVSKQPQPSSESSWRPADHRGAVPHETSHHAEYYLHEAKRMKHRADAMVDKLGKAVNYVDAALSFMECGKAMEEGPLEAKSPYTMYSETVELIRYAMKLKSHSGPGARQEDKQLAVLCFRCLALLYWQMFRLKKDHALKYSKVLLDYFKSSPKVPTTPPGWNDCGKSMGEHPSSLSPNARHRRRDPPGGSSSSLISIPQRIHQMAANHLNITNSVLYSYEYWEVADNLAKENKEFFNYLNTLSGPLTIHSSVAHAVQYTRQALQWIRISAKLN
uniref:AF4/FMR2 family, member 3 n=1 Tax=Nothobranchius kuhntae TaxID=321403 RepID=A0A1A8ISG4_NOTKU